MKTLALAAAASLALAGAASAQDVDLPAGDYRLDKNHATITWRVRHFNTSSYVARFKDFDAELYFDPEHPEMSRLRATVDVTSLDLDYDVALGGGISFYDQLMGNPYQGNPDGDPSFFNAPRFPVITFESTSVEVTGENTGKVTGNLTMLGQSHPVTLDVVYNGARPGFGAPEPMIGFSATTTITRSQWGMSIYAPDIVGDDVEVWIEAEFFAPAG